MFLKFGEGDHGILTRCPGSPFSRSVSHGSLSSRSLKKPKFAFLKPCDPAFCLAPVSWNLEHYYLIVEKAAPNLHIPDHFFHLCEYNIQQISSPRKLLTYFIQEIITNAFQEHSDCSGPSLLPFHRYQVIEVTDENR